MTADEHDVGLSLADSSGHRAHAHLGHELHVYTSCGVGVLEVVDELLEIFDRVDVVMRGWADEPNSGRAVTGLGDPRIHLVAGQLTTLARLGTLRHLDLQIIGVHEVLAGDTEATAGNLLDAAATSWVVQSVAVLATLASVALRSDRVHRDCKGLVRLGADAAVTHRASGEAFDDVFDRLDIFNRKRLPI